MDNNEIIRVAREAGAEATHYETWGDVYEFDVELLERFAALVAANEREACAKVCDNISDDYRKCFIKYDDVIDAGKKNASSECAAAIRARGEK